MQVNVTDLSYSIHEGRSCKRILKNVSLGVSACELCAVLGVSGSGKRKTSGKWSGDISFNGQESMRSIDDLVAYVRQDDVHLANLTVEETLRFAAWTKMPNGSSRKEREERVSELLETLGLCIVRSRFVGDALSRGISGGQLRRLSIGVEMTSFPQIILLDEPTSGLDSSVAYEVMKCVKGLCQQGRTVLSAIHQPSHEMFQLFDRLILMSRGQVVFEGSAAGAVPYFTSPMLGYSVMAHHNPAEFLLDVSSGRLFPEGHTKPRTVDELAELCRSVHTSLEDQSLSNPPPPSPSPSLSSIPTTDVGHRRRPRRPGMLVQLHMLLVRGWLVAVRDKQEIKSNLAKNCLVGLLTALLFWQEADVRPPFFTSTGLPLASINSVCSLLYFTMMFTFISNTQIIAVLCDRDLMYRRELAAKTYTTLPHWIASVLLPIPVLLITYSIMVLVCYFACGFPRTILYFGYMFSLLFLSTLNSFYTAQFIASASGNAAVAFALYPLVFVFLCNFAGFSANLKTIPSMWHWATIVSFARWVYEGLVVNEFSQFQDPVSPFLPDQTSGGLVLEALGFDGFDKYSSFWILGVNCVVILTIMYVAMLPRLSRLRKCSAEELDNDDRRARVKALNTPKFVFFRISSGCDLSEKLLSDVDSETEDNFSTSLNPKSPASDENHRGRPTGYSLLSMRNGGYRDLSLNSSWSKGCTLIFDSVSYSVQCRRSKATLQVLDKVSGVAHPGTVVCVLGSSGSGKTTLLDVLAGRKTTGSESGHVLVNGVDVSRRARGSGPGSCSCSCAYVTQDSVCIGVLTVRETLGFAARLRTPGHLSAHELREKVDAMLQVLGLTEHADSIVGDEKSGHGRGISGGQLKRLSIGVEIIDSADLVLMDEPTTGLDSAMALEVMTLVRDLASQNRTILCSVHQPSSSMYSFFDSVLLLADGRVIYFGAADELVPFFVQSPFRFEFPEGGNPADLAVSVASGSARTLSGRKALSSELAAFYSFSDKHRLLAEALAPALSRLASTGTGSTGTGTGVGIAGAPGTSTSGSLYDWAMCGLWRASGFGHRWRLCRGRQSPTSVLRQTRVLCERVLLQNLRDPKVVIVTTLRHLLIACFYLSLYWELPETDGQSGEAEQGRQLVAAYANRFSIFFFSLTFMVMGHQQSMSSLFESRLLFYRERGAGSYGAVPYMISLVFLKLVMILVDAAVFAAVVYQLHGLHHSAGKFLFFYSVLTLMSAVGLFLALLVSALSSSAQVALNFFPVYLFVSVAFAGYMRYLPSFPHWCKTWLPYLSFLRWGFQALVLNELQDNTALENRQYFLALLGFDTFSKEECLPFIALFLFIFAAMGIAALHFVSFEKR